jgi:hypothetical protein
MDPTPATVTCDGACTVSLVVSINSPPFNLTEAEGAQIAGAILAVLAVGWAFRVLIQLLRSSDGATDSADAD